MQYPPELIQSMIKAGQDPSQLVSKLAPKEERIKIKVVDPFEEKLKELEDEHLIAFMLAEKNYDTVYNIGHNWSFPMVHECLRYVNIMTEEVAVDRRKIERE